MIQQIGELGSEPELQPLGNVQILVDAQVEVIRGTGGENIASAVAESAFEAVIESHLLNNSYVAIQPGDFDRDRCVGFDDLKTFTSQWLQQGSGLAADLNADSKVDFSDFSLLGENWPGGATCP